MIMRRPLTITLLLIAGVLPATTLLGQSSQPHVPFNELHPTKKASYGDEATYIKAHQNMHQASDADTGIKETSSGQTFNDEPDEYPSKSYIDQLVTTYELGNKGIEPKIASLIKNGTLTPTILKKHQVDPNSKLYKRVGLNQEITK